MRISDGGLWLDTLKGVLLTLTLFLAYVTFPLFGMLPGFFAPLPSLFFVCKRGPVAGILILTFCTALLAAFGDPAVPLLYLLQSGVPALLLGSFYRAGQGVMKSISYTVAIDFALIILLAIGYGAAKGVDLQALVLKGIETSITQTASLYENQGLKGEDLQFLKQGMQQGGVFIARTFPALLLVSLGTIAGLNLMALFRFGRQLLPLPERVPFREFRTPEPLVWVVIVAGFAMLVPERNAQTVALNVLIATGFIYFMQGLAVLQHHFDRFALPRFMRILVYLFMLLQPYLLLGLASVGIFDIWGNFRTPKTK